jgi:hypothetical protein
MYRRIAFCGTSASASALELSDACDYKSAIRQITNLRYDGTLDDGARTGVFILVSGARGPTV